MESLIKDLKLPHVILILIVVAIFASYAFSAHNSYHQGQLAKANLDLVKKQLDEHIAKS